MSRPGAAARAGARPRVARHRAARTGRTGRAGLAWLALLALASLAVVLWLQAPPPGAPQALEAAGNSSTPLPAEPSGSARTEVPASLPPALEVGRSASQPRPIPDSFDERVLDGRGRIRGFVQAPPGIEFPPEWKLVLGPSPSLIGNDRAESRTLDFRAGEREFLLDDLPLGGYALSARAYGMATIEQHLLLAKPGETDLYVALQFALTAVVDGTVRLEDTSAVAGLELALEPRPAGARTFATTDEYGRFTFTDVREGGYTLHFGRPDNPVREPIPVDVLGPSERLADLIVPRLCELLVRVELEPGVPAVGVEVEGYGDHGGRFALRTDEQGECRARFLPAGRITVDARAPSGASVRGRQVVEPGVPGFLVLVLAR